MKDRASRAGPRDTPWHKMRPGIGIEMDSTALHELIAQVRGTAAGLAEAERKVAAFKAELAEQEHRAQLGSAVQRAIRPIPKRTVVLTRESPRAAVPLDFAGRVLRQYEGWARMFSAARLLYVRDDPRSIQCRRYLRKLSVPFKTAMS
jgi:hypothetical protein